ncbi:MAG TPA: hypothetical protein VM889_07550 [Candidatus Thermoplasmatota archaeon]|nr:hypothetical protein [Candidatus Thermoplasmatota archaeon]
MGFATIALVLSLLAPLVAEAAVIDLTYEAVEQDRALLDAAGQMNCVLEAYESTPSDACPTAPTTVAYPSSGIRMLDGQVLMYFMPNLRPCEPPRTSGCSAVYGDLQTSTGGLAPAAIWPGPTAVRAWLGIWNDADGNNLLETSATPPYTSQPDNEWLAERGARVFTWIEPGAHPRISDWEKPEADEPDIRYQFSDPHYWGGGIVVMVDGSLLQAVSVTTVNNPSLVPDEGAGTSYTVLEGSFVDLDRYAALAPGPIVALYASTAAAVVNDVGSPYGAHCPLCLVEAPRAASGTPAAEPAGRAQAPLRARYDTEWAAGNGSSIEGRLEEFQAGWHARVDLLPIVGFAYTTTTADAVNDETYDLATAAVDGRPTVPPGAWFHPRIWTGVWRDANGDGYVGHASAPDPYEYGARPNPDDHDHPQGEFLGWAPTNVDAQSRIAGWLVPDTSWGLVCSRVAPTCWSGTEPLRWTAKEYIPPKEGTYTTTAAWFFPQGSPGFKVCTDPLDITFRQAGIDVKETAWDCDAIARWAP